MKLVSKWNLTLLLSNKARVGSTQYILICLIRVRRKNVNNSYFRAAVFMDIPKAFECIG